MTKAELVERLNLFPDDTIIRVTKRYNNNFG